MIAKTYILKELKKLEKLFDEATKGGDTDLQKFYSKLTLLEFCGWIEQSMDDVVARTKKKLKEPQNVAEVDRIIDNNFSFKYKNLRYMLIKTVGIFMVERLEKRINTSKKTMLESSLNTLKRIRDDHAHRYVYGTTARFYAPSFTINHFNKVYDGLRELEKKL